MGGGHVGRRAANTRCSLSALQAHYRVPSPLHGNGEDWDAIEGVHLSHFFIFLTRKFNCFAMLIFTFSCSTFCLTRVSIFCSICAKSVSTDTFYLGRQSFEFCLIVRKWWVGDWWCSRWRVLGWCQCSSCGGGISGCHCAERRIFHWVEGDVHRLPFARMRRFGECQVARSGYFCVVGSLAVVFHVGFWGSSVSWFVESSWGHLLQHSYIKFVLNIGFIKMGKAVVDPFSGFIQLIFSDHEQLLLGFMSFKYSCTIVGWR